MEEQLEHVYKHMRGLGLGALAHANTHACFFSHDNPWWSELSVLQAAHAAEILIKARIAEEHPLLIFDQLPKARTEADQLLSMQDLVQGGRTYQFADLPDRLWAVTGIRLPNFQRYRAFGRLRNTIQHFTAPDGIDVASEAMRFIYDVIDPFINSCWGLYAVDFNEDSESEYLMGNLIRCGIRFLVSPGVVEHVKHIELTWPTTDVGYQTDMEARFAAARAAAA